MKKNLALILFFGLTIQIFGQLNPVNNFDWDHDYIYPPGSNYFTLSWEIPDSSTDSLIGYNIYGGNELYKFQTYIGAYCREYDSTDCDFMYNFLEEGDYIKVTAVYNSPPQESIAVDSAIFWGLAIGIEDLTINEKTRLFPNPTNGIVKIDSDNIRKIIVINTSGTIIQEQIDKSFIDLSDYSKGIYYIKIITDKGIKTEKVVLE